MHKYSFDCYMQLVLYCTVLYCKIVPRNQNKTLYNKVFFPVRKSTDLLIKCKLIRQFFYDTQHITIHYSYIARYILIFNFFYLQMTVHIQIYLLMVLIVRMPRPLCVKTTSLDKNAVILAVKVSQFIAGLLRRVSSAIVIATSSLLSSSSKIFNVAHYSRSINYINTETVILAPPAKAQLPEKGYNS